MQLLSPSFHRLAVCLSTQDFSLKDKSAAIWTISLPCRPYSVGFVRENKGIPETADFTTTEFSLTHNHFPKGFHPARQPISLEQKKKKWLPHPVTCPATCLLR
ncbi:MAG: hypothetical protein HY842_02715 [Bacteroidetes bacterium]|nr:hypothetical protein [Bacteroidota bacterium]